MPLLHIFSLEGSLYSIIYVYENFRKILDVQGDKNFEKRI
jgi:hypothetical protein